MLCKQTLFLHQEATHVIHSALLYTYLGGTLSSLGAGQAAE
jgi:hypothetical protein